MLPRNFTSIRTSYPGFCFVPAPNRIDDGRARQKLPRSTKLARQSHNKFAGEQALRHASRRCAFPALFHTIHQQYLWVMYGVHYGMYNAAL
jgi:hypothetical protein